MSSREFHFQPRWINGKMWPAVKQLTDNCFPKRPHRTAVSKRSEASQGVTVSARAWAPAGVGREGLCWWAGQGGLAELRGQSWARGRCAEKGLHQSAQRSTWALRWILSHARESGKRATAEWSCSARPAYQLYASSSAGPARAERRHWTRGSGGGPSGLSPLL